MVVHIVHQRTARKTDPVGSLLPNEDGLLSSDEILPFEEAIHAVHSDESSAHDDCAKLNQQADTDQVKHFGKVLKKHTWTVTSMLVQAAAAAAKTAPAGQA